MSAKDHFMAQDGDNRCSGPLDWEHPELRVLKVISMGGGFLVLIDWLEVLPQGFRSNLVRVDSSGHVVWSAQPPKDEHTPATNGEYTEILSVEPLRAYWSTGYGVDLDPQSGLVTSQVFTK